MPDQRQQARIAAQPLLHQLRQQQGEGVEHQSGHDGDQQQHDDSAPHQGGGISGKAAHRAAGCPRAKAAAAMPGPARHRPGQARRNAARQPTWLARNAVTTGASATPTLPNTPFRPIARPGLVAGGVHQHRGADRMIDRGEQPGRRHAQRQHQRRGGERRRHHGQPGADEEHRHQRRPSDALCDPALRQREQPVEHEHAGRERQDRPVVARRTARPARPWPGRRSAGSAANSGSSVCAALMKAIRRELVVMRGSWRVLAAHGRLSAFRRTAISLSQTGQFDRSRGYAPSSRPRARWSATRSTTGLATTAAGTSTRGPSCCMRSTA